VKLVKITEKTGELKKYGPIEDEKTSELINRLPLMGHTDLERIDVIDLNSDYDWMLSECYKKRVSEYPPVGDQLDALMKFALGDSSELTAIAKKCDGVKKKYPKPVKG